MWADYFGQCGLQALPHRPKQLMKSGLYISNETARLTAMIEVFISHASQDARLAEALVVFLRDALSLQRSEIRCTSVDGCRLPAGANTENQLRCEIVDATYFLALITPTTLKSPWVLIELGARWAVERPLMPLLAKGATAKNLQGPLVSFNALRCDKEPEMQQLVHEMAETLGRAAPQPSVYRRTLNQLIAQGKPVSSVAPSNLNPALINSLLKLGEPGNTSL